MEIAVTVIITIMCMAVIFIGVIKIIERAHEKEIKLLEQEHVFNLSVAYKNRMCVCDRPIESHSANACVEE